MRVAMISIGNCPSLALRNLKRYCTACDGEKHDIRVFDYDIREFRESRVQAVQTWYWITKIDEVVEELTEWQPAVLAFSCYLWNTELSIHLAHLLKMMLPDVVVVLGGPDAGPRSHSLLDRHRHIDLVIEGDGEIPFLHLLRQVEGGEPDYAEVPSARFRNNGEIVVNPSPLQQLDLSQLTDVYGDGVPSTSELSAWPWPNLLYETLRGCPYACTYCMYGKTKMNEKDVDLVIDEIAALLEQGLIVEIIDPTFTTIKKRAKRILGGLAQRTYSGRLHFEAYADSIDEEMAELLVATRTGCIGIGFQTLSSEGLKAVKRPKNLLRFERGIRLLEAHKLYFYVDIIYGLPETTLEDFFATVDYLFDQGITRLMIYRLLGLPGSPMMADVEKYGLKFSDDPPYELLASSTYSLKDLILCDRFQKAYEKLLGFLPLAELRPWAAAAGGVSKLIREFMELYPKEPPPNQEELRQSLARKIPQLALETRNGTPPANGLASHSTSGSAAPTAPSAV